MPKYIGRLNGAVILARIVASHPLDPKARAARAAFDAHAWSNMDRLTDAQYSEVEREAMENEAAWHCPACGSRECGGPVDCD